MSLPRAAAALAWPATVSFSRTDTSQGQVEVARPSSVEPLDICGKVVKNLRIATVVIIVVMQEVDGNGLIPGAHDGHVQLRYHSIGNLIPPAPLQHDLRAISA
jgi:hypothetical protein